MKRRIAVILLLLLIIPLGIYAEENADITYEILDGYVELYGDAIEEGVEKIDPLDELVSEINIKKVLKDVVDGKLAISPKELIFILLQGLLKEVYKCLKIMATVLTASILCSYLSGLNENFGKSGVTDAAYYTCYIIIASVASVAFYDVAACAVGAIENISVFMEMLVPVVVTTLLAGGAIVSASVFEPVLLGIIEVAVRVIQDLFIPLVMVATALSIVNGISDRFKIQRLINFINQCIKRGLTIMLTIFVSTAGIQSIASSGADGLTIKLTKFATSNLIPVVGGILAESVETVMNCSVLIKNSVGVIGIICLSLIAVTPLLKIGAVLIIFRLTAAISEPVTEPKITVCLSELANSISVLFSMLTATTVMAILVLTIMINAGNIAIFLGR